MCFLDTCGSLFIAVCAMDLTWVFLLERHHSIIYSMSFASWLMMVRVLLCAISGSLYAVQSSISIHMVLRCKHHIHRLCSCNLKLNTLCKQLTFQVYLSPVFVFLQFSFLSGCSYCFLLLSHLPCSRYLPSLAFMVLGYYLLKLYLSICSINSRWVNSYQLHLVFSMFKVMFASNSRIQ